MGIGFGRMNQPGYVMRIVPGPNPAETALTEVYVRRKAHGVRAASTWISTASSGRRWRAVTWRASTEEMQRASERARGGERQALPRRLDALQNAGRNSRALTLRAAPNHAYYIWVDRYNTLGLGANVPIANTNGGESLLAVVDGKMVDLRVPYPLAQHQARDAASTTRTPAGKAKACGPCRARAQPCSTTKAARRTAQGVQDPDPSGSARETDVSLLAIPPQTPHGFPGAVLASTPRRNRHEDHGTRFAPLSHWEHSP